MIDSDNDKHYDNDDDINITLTSYLDSDSSTCQTKLP